MKSIHGSEKGSFEFNEALKIYFQDEIGSNPADFLSKPITSFNNIEVLDRIVMFSLNLDIKIYRIEKMCSIIKSMFGFF